MKWLRKLRLTLRRMLVGDLDDQLRHLESQEPKISEALHGLETRVEKISEEQCRQRGRYREVLLVLRRDKCVKWVRATAAIGTALIGLVTVIIGVKGCERATQEIELIREKAFYRPGIVLQETSQGTNNWMVFAFKNPGERTFQDFRAAWEIAHIPSQGDVNRGTDQPLKQVWGVVNGGDALGVRLPIPPTNDNLYAMAVCSGISIFNGESRTNRAAAVRYRFAGRWYDYRGDKALGDKDRETVEKELHRLHEINRAQSPGKYSDNW